MNQIRSIETWGRIGFAARGLVYLLLGYIALTSGRALSAGQAVREFGDFPGGSIILPLLALGLFGYGSYKIYTAAIDLGNEGDNAKGWAKRAASAIGGLGYWILAFIAAKQAFSGREGSAEAGQAGGSSGAQETAAQVAGSGGGDLLLIVAGLIVLAVAAAQFLIAYKAKFMREMPGAPPLVKPAGQIGYLARAVIITIVGYFIIQAGIDGERVRSTGDALALLREDYGTLFKLIAGGLMLFGIVSLLMARYRRIEDDDVIRRLETATR